MFLKMLNTRLAILRKLNRSNHFTLKVFIILEIDYFLFPILTVRT